MAASTDLATKERVAPVKFPRWVTDDTATPRDFLVRGKKLVYTFIAVEKLRRLHNAAWKWHRSERLTADERQLLADAFPTLWPNPPTEQQVRTWVTNWWEPRHDTAQATRTTHRRAVMPNEFNHVDLDALI